MPQNSDVLKPSQQPLKVTMAECRVQVVKVVAWPPGQGLLGHVRSKFRVMQDEQADIGNDGS